MSENVVQGDVAPTDLPKTQVSEELLQFEKNLAKYSKTKEFKVLKDYLEARIEFFQKQLPNGDFIVNENKEGELIIHWKVANIVIGEFKAVLERYEQASEVVKDVQRPGA